MRRAALLCLPQEKQCANSATVRARGRAVEQRGELQALGIVEVEPLGRHLCLLDGIVHLVL